MTRREAEDSLKEKNYILRLSQKAEFDGRLVLSYMEAGGKKNHIKSRRTLAEVGSLSAAAQKLLLKLPPGIEPLDVSTDREVISKESLIKVFFRVFLQSF